jgi:hypothetical protein
MIILFELVAILEDIHKLNEYIRNGEEDKAVGRVQKLIKKGVRLQSDNSKGLSKDDQFQYVKIIIIRFYFKHCFTE